MSSASQSRATGPSAPPGTQFATSDLHRLKERWRSSLAASEVRNQNGGPIVPSRCTRVLMDAVDRVVATAKDTATPLEKAGRGL